jgi:intracellular sulfur oxidation DsrE/DsrF family protein
MDRRLLLTAPAVLGALGAPRSARSAAPSHRLALHVDRNEATIMNMALGNAGNAAAAFAARGEDIALELVAYGPGLTMLRADTSPVKDRLAALHEKLPQMVFSACHNTLEAVRRAEGKDIPLLPQARIVPSGVVRLIELQEQGWSYIKV